MSSLRINGFHGEFRFLSNFAPVTVEYEGMSFPSVEHAYVAAKTTDLEKRREIQQVPTAGQVKRLGRRLKVREDWEDIKVDVMRDLLIQKFSQEPYKTKLIQTRGYYLEETNTWGDTFWGVCEGVGDNVLGWILMEIRGWLEE